MSTGRPQAVISQMTFCFQLWSEQSVAKGSAAPHPVDDDRDVKLC